MRPRSIAGLLILALFADSGASLARAREDEEAIQRLISDQEQIFDRLLSLKDMMERLADKLAEQERPYKAELLRAALKEIDERGLMRRKDEVLEKLRTQNLQAIEAQKKLLEDLEEVYHILLDQARDRDLEKELEVLKQSAADLKGLRNAERKLREDTEKLSGSAKRRLQDLEQKIAEIQDSQRKLSEESKDLAGDTPSSAEKLRAELREAMAWLSKIVEKHGRLDQGLELEIESSCGDSKTVLKAARSALDSQRPESLAEAARRVDQQVAEGLKEKNPPLGEALEKLGEKLREAARSAQAGTPDDGEPREQAEQALKTAEEEMQKALAAAQATLPFEKLAQEENELHEEVQGLLDSLESGASPDAVPARATLKEARSSMQQAEQNLRDQKLEESSSQVAQAQKQLEQALRDMEKKLATTRNAMEARASRQDFLEGMTRRAEEDAESIAGSQTPEEAEHSREAGRQLEDAASAMNEAKGALAQGESAKASQAQKSAEQSLENAQKEVRESLAESGQDSERRAGQEELDRLADRQKEIREKVRDLMRRLQDLSREIGRESLSRAENSMARAEQELEEAETAKAEESEREAEKNLEDAEKNIDEEKRRYQDLRAEELLFKLKQNLEELKQRTEEVLTSLATIDQERADADRLPRHLRPQVSKLASDLAVIVADNAEAKKLIDEEGSATFSMVLGQCAENLGRAREELDSRNADTGPLVQLDLEETVRSYGKLLSALEDEMRRRREAAQQQQSGGQPPPPGQRRLVPTVAELQLLRDFEIELRDDLQVLALKRQEMQEEGSEEVSAQILERLGHRHLQITEMFNELIERLGSEPQQEPEEGDAGAEGKSKSEGDGR